MPPLSSFPNVGCPASDAIGSFLKAQGPYLTLLNMKHTSTNSIDGKFPRSVFPCSFVVCTTLNCDGGRTNSVAAFMLVQHIRIYHLEFLSQSIACSLRQFPSILANVLLVENSAFQTITLTLTHFETASDLEKTGNRVKTPQRFRYIKAAGGCCLKTGGASCGRDLPAMRQMAKRWVQISKR